MSIDYNAKMQFPNNDNYALRITDAEFSPSKSSGNPMITLTTEIVAPSTVEIDGDEVNIAGLEIKTYWTTKNLDGGEVNEEKTAASLKRVKTNWVNLGLDWSQFDPENPDVKLLKGLVFLAALGSDTKEAFKTQSAAEKAEKKKPEVMKNPITGKPVVFYNPKITEIFGKAPEGHAAYGKAGNRPY